MSTRKSQRVMSGHVQATSAGAPASTAGAHNNSLQRVVRARQSAKKKQRALSLAGLRNQIISEVTMLETRMNTTPTPKYDGAIVAYNQVRVWIEREQRRLRGERPNGD